MLGINKLVNNQLISTTGDISSISTAFSNEDRTITWTISTKLPVGTVVGAEIHSPNVADYILYPETTAAGDYFRSYDFNIPGWPSRGIGFIKSNSGSTSDFNGAFGNATVGAGGDITITSVLSDYDNFSRVSANTDIYLAITKATGTPGQQRQVRAMSSNVYITQETGMSITGGTTTILSALNGNSEPAANAFCSTTEMAGRRVTEVLTTGTTVLTVDTGNLSKYPTESFQNNGNVNIHAVAGGGGGSLGSDVSSPGGGGGAGAYVFTILSRDADKVINLVNNSNITVNVGTGGSSAVGSNVEATNSSISYDTVISGNITKNLLRGGMGYSGFPGDEDGGSGSGADWKDGVPGTGIGATPSDGVPAGNDGGNEDVPGGASLRSAGGGGGAYSSGFDASTNTGGDGGQGIIGTGYTGRSGFGIPSNLDSVNIPSLPLANVFLAQGGGGGSLTAGVPRNTIGVPGLYQSGGNGGTDTANPTTVVANSGSGGGGGKYGTGGSSSTYFPGSAGASGSFAIGYKAAWRKFTTSL